MYSLKKVRTSKNHNTSLKMDNNKRRNNGSALVH